MQSADTLAPFRATLRDRRGLVWAYALPSGEAVDDDRLDRADFAGPVWMHFSLTDARARAYLRDRAELPEKAIELLLDAPPRVRLCWLEQALVGVVDDLHHDFRGDPEGFGELRFYVDDQRVVSVRRHPLHGVDRLRRQVAAGLCVETTAEWLVHFIEALAESYGGAVADLVAQVDQLEDQIVDGEVERPRAGLAGLRRLLVRFRRHVGSDRQALAALRARPQFDDDTLAQLRRALEHLDGVAQDLDLVHERVRLLQDEVAGLLAEQTNRNLYLLSVVTTVLLPTTVVTGLWGMNVSDAPFQEGAHGFFWVSLLVVLSILISLVLLRRSRVL